MARKGTVYILTHPAMPILIKVRMKQQQNLETRVPQLNNTSVPLPFEVFFAGAGAARRGR